MRTRTPAALLLLLAAAPAGAAPESGKRFTGGVAPLLRQRCLSCHDGAKKRGGLDLSTRAGALRGGDTGPAVTPGDAAKSKLLEMVGGPTPRMPKQGPKLTAAETDDLRRWVAAGAPWPVGVTLTAEAAPRPAGDWWSLRPLARPDVPAPKGRAWVRTPVDAFVLTSLEAKGLRTSPPADKRTLLRRVTFDLTGLPPTPEEVEDFLADTSDNAYAKVVERLLASPRYGERWGRHWLDVVHYGDTHGYDKDKRRDHAWPYRDYVIRSFNDDKPYGRFVREQLAGDVLYPGDPDGVVATGFVAAGPWDFVGHVELREGTVEKEKTRVLDRDDMVATTAATFLSLTAGCARCHDHKFDPIPQKDYYALQAVFAGVDRGDRPYLDAAALARKATLDAERAGLARRRDALRGRVAKLEGRALADADEAIRKLRDRLERSAPRPRGAPVSPTNGYHSGISATAEVTKWVQVDLGKSLPLDEVRLFPARPTDFPDTPGFGFPARFRVEASDTPDFRTARALADQTAADFPNPGDEPVRVRSAGVTARYVRVTATRLWRRTGDYVFALAELQVDAGGRAVACGAEVAALDSIEAGRWSTHHLVDGFDSRHPLPGAADPKAAAALRERLDLLDRLHDAERDRRTRADRLVDEPLRRALSDADAGLARVDRELQSVAEAGRVYAVLPTRPRPVHVLHRGDVERPRAAAAAGALSCGPGLESVFALKNADDEGIRRAALAAWVADPRNPLTWRSAANRVWHYHFGRGLVDTPNDFGRNGSLPTHPELLDWLAAELRETGSFKRLHRLVVLSSTYRQASAPRPDLEKADADNRLLGRMNRRRLDAEEVRDAVLAVSGKLDPRMGGPGFELFRFKDDHSPVYDHAAPEKADDPATFRRTVYRFTVRSVPNPLLDTLDCADPNINTAVRNTTLTALQALALLNDSFLLKQAGHFAGRLRKAGGDSDRQPDVAYRLALGRPATAEERAALAAYAKKHGLANACRVVFNLNEFVFVD